MLREQHTHAIGVASVCFLGLLAVLLSAAWLISIQLNRKLFLAFEIARQAYNHVCLFLPVISTVLTYT